MRLSLFVSLAALAPFCAGLAEAQTRHQPSDGSVAYVVPAGFEVINPPGVEANQAVFSVVRTVAGTKARVGVCVMGGATLLKMPNMDTWNAMIVAHRTDTEGKARARIKAPATFVRVGGYRDLTLADGDGYAFWYQQQRARGETTEVSLTALLRPQFLMTGNCTSSAGQAFNPAEVEAILKLATSARRP